MKVSYTFCEQLLGRLRYMAALVCAVSVAAVLWQAWQLHELKGELELVRASKQAVTLRQTPAERDINCVAWWLGAKDILEVRNRVCGNPKLKRK